VFFHPSFVFLSTTPTPTITNQAPLQTSKTANGPLERQAI